MENITYVRTYQDYYRQQDNSNDNVLISLAYWQDPRVQITERKLYTIFDALSQTGGLMGLLFAVIKFLLADIQKFFFYSSLGKQMFYEIKGEEDESGK